MNLPPQAVWPRRYRPVQAGSSGGTVHCFAPARGGTTTGRPSRINLSGGIVATNRRRRAFAPAPPIRTAEGDYRRATGWQTTKNK